VNLVNRSAHAVSRRHKLNLRGPLRDRGNPRLGSLGGSRLPKNINLDKVDRAHHDSGADASVEGAKPAESTVHGLESLSVPSARAANVPADWLAKSARKYSAIHVLTAY
jgi:hypothetical protein